MSSIGDALFTKTQQRVLGLLYGKPDQSFYTTEIMLWADVGRGAVSRELDKLQQAGLVTMSRSGNQTHYRANPESPIYSELLGIVRKTFGVADVIRAALKPVDEKIELAFVYGSMAKSSDTARSDIDLLLVGEELEYGEIMEYLLPVEELLNRPTHPTLYRVDEFITKRETGNSFLTRILEQPKWMIKGEIDDIGKPGQNQSAQAGTAGSGGI